MSIILMLTITESEASLTVEQRGALLGLKVNWTEIGIKKVIFGD
jgi:hypothetical protein